MVHKIAIVLLLISFSFSQQKLSLEQALAIALENNYDIQISKNNHRNVEKNVLNQLNRFLPSASIGGRSTTQKTSRSVYNGDILVGTQDGTSTLFGGNLGIKLGNE